ncbi:lantibiotic dehydratase [Nonomuraea pusilla]|uniref:lantibiotic dehydratase n=1 Tax=Nonomuraea pusilla TaxID=46177 RepID=UPI0033233001
MEVGREIVVRVAGLPAAVLADLRLPHTAELVTHLSDERRRLAAEAAALSVELFDLIGAAGSARAALVGLRRALAPGHRPPSPRLIGLCPLPVPLAERVTAWVRARHDWEDRRRDLAGTLDKERADALDRVRAACAAPAFRRGLALSGGELTSTLERWLADPGRAPRQGKVLRLVKYLTRAAAKTSPYGSFMVSALAGRPGDGPAIPELLTVAEPPGAFLDAVGDALLADPALAGQVPLRPNPSLTRTAQGLLFVRTVRAAAGEQAGPKEEIATAGRAAALELCLRHAESRPTAPRLAELLAEAGADPGEAAAFVDRLVAAQLLLPCPPVHDDDPDPFGAWARRVGAPELRELAAASRPMAAAVDSPGRRRARIAAAAAAVADRLGIDPPADPAHEHDVSTGRPAPPPLPVSVLADLDAVRRWLAVFDWKVPVRVGVGAFCRERFGSGSRTPFLEACRAATAALPHLFGPAAMPWFLDLTGDGRLRELDRLRTRARDLARSCVLDRRRVLADTADWPAWLTWPASTGFYLQTLPGGVVLNAVHAGHGRAAGRVHHLLARAGAAPPRPPRSGLPRAEFGGRFGSALNTRTPSTLYEIDHPGATSGRDPRHRVPLGTLMVVHDPDTDLVHLHSDRLGRVEPVHLGMMGELGLPAVAGFLERAFAPTYLFHPSVPPFISPRDLAGAPSARRFPRVSVGDVVVQRARWTVPAGLVPARTGADGDHLLALAEWRHEHGIPERCFVRGWKPGAALGKARKPLYVDFAAWHLVALFEREARTNAALVIDEALPDPLADGAPAHVTEYHVEIGDRGSGR